MRSSSLTVILMQLEMNMCNETVPIIALQMPHLTTSTIYRFPCSSIFQLQM